MNPDVLIVNLHWFMLSSFIRDLPCKKVFLCREVEERFFTVPLGEKALAFRSEDYDLSLSIEPFRTSPSHCGESIPSSCGIDTKFCPGKTR